MSARPDATCITTAREVVVTSVTAFIVWLGFRLKITWPFDRPLSGSSAKQYVNIRVLINACNSQAERSNLPLLYLDASRGCHSDLIHWVPVETYHADVMDTHAIVDC